MIGTSNTCLGSWQTQNKNSTLNANVSDDPLAFISNKTMGMHLPSLLTPSLHNKDDVIFILLISIK